MPFEPQPNTLKTPSTILDEATLASLPPLSRRLKKGLRFLILRAAIKDPSWEEIKSMSKSIKLFVVLSNRSVSDKLILLHGPNGSAKSSTVEALARGLHLYSQLEEGAVYTFNWIFPTDRSSTPQGGAEATSIGFGASRQENGSSAESYALLDESKISCKITSEFRDNPLYLLPLPQREELLRRWMAKSQNKDEADVHLPSHILMAGLSKKNQLIFENLLAAYNGDLSKTLRHVQVERFFYSKQYRVGVATVEPQLAIDAREQQLTMDKNLSNLPSILQNIRFHEASGPLVEANRGLLEYSDMLKRPVDAYKYLLSTVEKSSLTLPSSTAHLDIVFFATTNDKHFDAFKALPDFPSFRSRFELVTVPYLLRASLEEQIYCRDLDIIRNPRKLLPMFCRAWRAGLS